MNELKESDLIAEKLTVRDTFEIVAKSITEFDALMVEIKKKQEQYPYRNMDIVCEWNHPFFDGSDKRVLSYKNVPINGFSMLVNTIREAEDDVISYLNKDKIDDSLKIVPVFSCSVKLRIEKKDKPAQQALEDDKQLALFAPLGLSDNQKLFDSLITDGITEEAEVKANETNKV